MDVLSRNNRRRSRRSLATLTALGVFAGVSLPGVAAADASHDGPDRRLLGVWEVQSLDGADNNPRHPTWGMANTNYPRVAAANYADGLGEPVNAPNPRYISNRVINDTGLSLYSEGNVSQWGFVWGQFLDHTFAERLGRREVSDPAEPAPIVVDDSDPMEFYRTNLGFIPFDRSAIAPGSGIDGPREQINTHSSYVDAATIYGQTEERLDWLRVGSVDGDPRNNNARLLMSADDYLPRRDARGNPDSAPLMVVGSNVPARVAVAGDARANENPPLLATHTLFAREHNRIVARLPRWLSEEDKFQIARAVVIAEQQYITFEEFLPALGVTLQPYRGYRPTVNSSLSNEFATVAYRAHSQIRGDFRLEAEAGRYPPEDLDRLESLGVLIEVDGDTVGMTIPLSEDAFFNPDMLELLQLGPLLEGIGRNTQHNNDELIDNLLRSVVFDIPVPENPTCADEPGLPACIRGVNDLAAIDIARGRDHGMPTYNQLRVAMGLPAKTSFAAITGEESEEFPADPLLTAGDEINDPDSLDFVAIYNGDGEPTTPEMGDATSAQRRAPLAARLKAIYGSVDSVDAFVGMLSEPHVPGTEFGELQLTVWRDSFTGLRDGDRFFYANDPLLRHVRRAFGIDYRTSLGDLIARNTSVPRSAMPDNVFLTKQREDPTHPWCRWLPPAWCEWLDRHATAAKVEARFVKDGYTRSAHHRVASRNGHAPGWLTGGDARVVPRRSPQGWRRDGAHC